MKKTTNKSASTTASTAPAACKPTAPAPVAAATIFATVNKPVAPAPAISKPAGAKAASTTTIEAKIDIGFGNQLFVRGQGEGLSWDRGIPLENVDSKTWRLIVPAKDKLQFKLLINDSVWAKGEDVVAAPGKKVEVVPAF